jgi:uncharacterized repeat protein (TIGR03803 family)
MKSVSMDASVCALIPLGLAVAIGLATSAKARTYTRLHSFCSDEASNGVCNDGITPWGLIKAPSGTIYGVTELGGTNNKGTIFELVPGNGGYSFQVVYSFCAQASCTDGSQPRTALIADTNGNIYGTTRTGGLQNLGEVFRFTPGTGALKVLYSFCSQAQCTDGSTPYGIGGAPATLTYDGQQAGALYNDAQPLYGATSSGGSGNQGVVFKLTRSKANWTERVIHSFVCGDTACPEGNAPGYLGFDNRGHLIGTASGGAGGLGVVYKMSTRGAETVLYSFCSNGEPCTDGRSPGAFVVDSKNHIVGITGLGGADGGTGQSYNFGVFYRLSQKSRSETYLFQFCYNYDTVHSCPGGDRPAGALFQSGGIIYGSTNDGGLHNGGILFRQKGSGAPATLVDFCAENACTDGRGQVTGLAADDAGNIIGATAGGGDNGSPGVLFELSP